MATEDQDYLDVEIEDDENSGEGSTSDVDLQTESNSPSNSAVNDESHDNEDDDDEPLSDQDSNHEDGEIDPDREAIRQRRRQERQEKKQRQRDELKTLRMELQSRDAQLTEMRNRLDSIDRRNTGGDLARIQEAKQKLGQAYNYYKEQIRLGTEAQNGAVVAEATEKLGQIRDRVNQLTSVEKAYQRQATTPPPLDSAVVQNARSWTEKHPWYDSTGRDPDSRIVLTIDNQLAEEGYDPRHSDYWDELSNRVKKYLPHRTRRDNMTSRPKSVVPGSGRESSTPTSAKTFRLSAERVKAIKDMGAWDDPTERNRMIKQYRDYDKANKGA